MATETSFRHTWVYNQRMGAAKFCAIQKAPEEQNLQEGASFMGGMLAGQGWVWLLLGLAAVVFALVIVLCLAGGTQHETSPLLLPLQREKYVAQMLPLTADGTVRVLRHLPVP